MGKISKRSFWKVVALENFKMVIFNCCCFGKFKKVVFNSCRYDGKKIVFRFKTENDIFPFSVAITSLIQVLNKQFYNWFQLIGNQTIMRALLLKIIFWDILYVQNKIPFVFDHYILTNKIFKIKKMLNRYSLFRY